MRKVWYPGYKQRTERHLSLSMSISVKLRWSPASVSQLSFMLSRSSISLCSRNGNWTTSRIQPVLEPLVGNFMLSRSSISLCSRNGNWTTSTIQPTGARTICVSLSVAQLHVERVLDLSMLSKRQLNNEQDSTGARNSVTDPDPSDLYVLGLRISYSDVRIRIRIRILLLSCKNSKENLYSYWLLTFYLWKMMKMYLQKVPNKQKKLFFKLVFVGVLKVNGVPVNTRIRIRTKMSWIRKID